MYRRTMLWGLGLLATVAPFEAAATTDEAFMCQDAARARRVELQHADTSDRLPCRVVYWRDATQAEDGRPIWEAEHDFGFCIERTRDLVQRLQNAGWVCQEIDPGVSDLRTIPAIAPSRLPAITPSAPPAVAPRESPSIAPGALPTIVPSALPTVAGADRAKLGEALARDLQRLERLTTSTGARFEIESAELGDLDRDGVDDAAVLLSYLSEHPGSAQFLMAYRFDGDTFVPAAKTYVGGQGGDVLATGIERIEDGAIELLLEVRQQGDLECCPSGRRRDSYVLQDSALVPLQPES